MKWPPSRFVYSALLLGYLSAFSSGQDPAPKREGPPPCPQPAINTPGQRIFKEGERLLFSAALAGADPAVNPSFVWTASAGVIESGQGTRSIAIDTAGAGSDRELTVELWIGGYPAECTVQTRASIKIVPPAARILEFGELPPAEETDRIRDFAKQLHPSDDIIYVLGYGGRTNPRAFANGILKRIKLQLLAAGIPYERLAFIDAGYREYAAFEFWIVPAGADAPRVTPTVSAKDIVFPRTPAPPHVKKP